MTLDLSRITFENEAFVYETDYGTLLFYALDENPPLDSGEATFKRILISLTDADDNETILSSVIGLERYGYKIQTDYTELEGSILTTDNIALCTLETPE